MNDRRSTEQNGGMLHQALLNVGDFRHGQLDLGSAMPALSTGQALVDEFNSAPERPLRCGRIWAFSPLSVEGPLVELRVGDRLLELHGVQLRDDAGRQTPVDATFLRQLEGAGGQLEQARLEQGVVVLPVRIAKEQSLNLTVALMLAAEREGAAGAAPQ